jgi:hypothetical protein
MRTPTIAGALVVPRGALSLLRAGARSGRELGAARVPSVERFTGGSPYPLR